MFTFLGNIITMLRYFFTIIISGSTFILREIPFIGFLFFPLELFGIFQKKKSKGERLRLTLTRLGPTFIKLGQVLATRPDIIGEDFSNELLDLQDRLPAFSSEKAMRILGKELGAMKQFKEISKEPIAAASIAQVHRAILQDGSQVAIKILRPNIRKRFKQDLKLFYFMARLINCLEKYKRLKLPEIVKYFEEITSKELDLRFEAAATSKLKDNMKTDKNIHIPEIYWQQSTQNVLTLEWIEGSKINDLKALKAAELDLKKLSHNLVICYFNQAYRDGYFHADMHPGNILVTKEGKISFIDCGIMGNLSDADRIYVTRIIDGFIKRDYDYIAKMHFDAGYVPSNTNINDFALACRSIGEPIFGKSVKELSIANMLAQLFQITERFGMQTQPQLLLLQKTLLMLEGIGAKLNPDLNIWQLGEPWMQNWAKENLSIRANLKRSREKIIMTAEKFPNLLQKINQALDELGSKKKNSLNSRELIILIAALCLIFFK